MLAAKVGQTVARGAPLATIHAPDQERAAQATAVLYDAFSIGDSVEPPPLMHWSSGDGEGGA